MGQDKDSRQNEYLLSNIFSPNLPVDYDLMVGTGYPKGNETNIDVLLYSKGSTDNMCGPKGEPISHLYIIRGPRNLKYPNKVRIAQQSNS